MLCCVAGTMLCCVAGTMLCCVAGTMLRCVAGTMLCCVAGTMVDCTVFCIHRGPDRHNLQVWREVLDQRLEMFLPTSESKTQ